MQIIHMGHGWFRFGRCWSFCVPQMPILVLSQHKAACIERNNLITTVYKCFHITSTNTGFEVITITTLFSSVPFNPLPIRKSN
jgi:hypothetical protein